MYTIECRDHIGILEIGIKAILFYSGNRYDLFYGKGQPSEPAPRDST